MFDFVFRFGAPIGPRYHTLRQLVEPNKATDVESSSRVPSR